MISERSVFTNVVWLSFDRLLRLGLGLFVGVWVARYLGPDKFGLLTYTVVLVSFFASTSMLGLQNVIVREIASGTEDPRMILGCGAGFQLIAGVVSYALLILFISIARPEDKFLHVAVAIVGISTIIKPFDTIRFWYESQVHSKYVIWSDSVIGLIFASAKVIAILYNSSLIVFFIIVAAEAVILCAGLYLVALKTPSFPHGWRFNWRYGRAMVRDGWPFLLSGMASLIYMRVDQIIIGEMLGNKSVGIYAAAARLSEIWYMVPSILVTSVMPGLISLRKIDHDLYLRRLQILFDVLILFSVFIALLTTFLAEFIIQFLYGNSYIGAADILKIQIWSGVFVAIGVARGPWIVAEGLQKFTTAYIVVAMMVSVTVNWLMIPLYGTLGAAISSVLAQATAAIIVPSMIPATRPSIIMALKACNPLRWKTLVRRYREISVRS
jgi:PST family polysaccharide transporter